MKPRLPNWSGLTAVCIASGPSLTAADCAAVRAARAPTVVTNTTFRMCPWAEALFGFDFAWWRVYHAEVRATFKGRQFCQNARWPRRGIEWPGAYRGYRSFGNSGACAVSLAIAAGASRVILLGYDAQLTAGAAHHHGDHPAPLRNCDTMPSWSIQFSRLAIWAAARRAEVINASRESALRCFRRETLEDALTNRQEIAA